MATQDPCEIAEVSFMYVTYVWIRCCEVLAVNLVLFFVVVNSVLIEK